MGGGGGGGVSGVPKRNGRLCLLKGAQRGDNGLKRLLITREERTPRRGGESGVMEYGTVTSTGENWQEVVQGADIGGEFLN